MSAPPLAPPRRPRRPARTAPAAVAAAGDEAVRPALPVRRGPAVPEWLLTAALALLMLSAVVPLSQVFIGTEWVRPVTGGVLLAAGIGWGARRLGAGPITHLLLSLGSLAAFITIAFLPATALWGLVPTPDTAVALRDLFVRGLELIELRPSPTFAEAGLLLLAVAGTWVTTYLADGMLFVLRSPLKAIACAVVTWSVPLAIAPQSTDLLVPVATLLGASTLLLLLGGTAESAGFGLRITAPGRDGRPRAAPVLPAPGVAIGVGAVVAGLLLAQLVPGFGAEALVEARGGSGTTITTNPIVDIRARLVASDTGPVAVVGASRPVYLRTTALDVYDDAEQWTAETISGTRVQGTVDRPPPVPVEQVEVDVRIDVAIDAGAVLAPAPFQPIAASGPKAASLRYDPRSATFTLPGDDPLVPGDSYAVTAAIPQPTADALRTVGVPGAGAPSTQLPPNVPPEVAALANRIVVDAGAQTMFDAALAIQDHLRTWEYSLTPEPGVGATAMLRFLDAQQGYCEQFAGTMAVMLRTLGIPSRLAVGYTPGEVDAEGRWTVTNGNAHAWVEVDFGELGWIPFEPTPRSDGNVLVTGVDSVVPTQTVAQEAGLVPSAAEPAGPGELSDVQTPPTAPLPPEDLQALQPVPGGAGGADGAGRLPWLVLLAVLGVVAGGVVWGRRRDGDRSHLPPAERIAHARTRVELVGHAVGRRRHPAETDAEYFARVGGGSRLADDLATPSTRAVYAPAVTAEEAARAERAAGRMAHDLTEPLPWGRRVLVGPEVAVRRWWRARGRSG